MTRDDTGHSSTALTPQESVIAQLEDLQRYARMLVNSRWDAEDLVQETFVRALNSSLLEHPNPRAYLFRIAKNAWIDKSRRKASGILSLPECVAEEGDNITTRLLLRDAMTILLEKLTPVQGVVFLLREAMGYSAAQTAELLHMSEGAVKSMLYRARANLRRHRDGDGFIDDETREGQVSEVQKDVLEAYLAMFRNHDVEGLVNLAMQDVIEPIHALVQLNDEVNVKTKKYKRIDGLGHDLGLGHNPLSLAA